MSQRFLQYDTLVLLTGTMSPTQSLRKSLLIPFIILFGLFLLNNLQSSVWATTSSVSSSERLIVGSHIHPHNPWRIDLLLQNPSSKPVSTETSEWVDIFQTLIRVRPDNIWVNLNPGEPDRILPPTLHHTTLGRQLLEQDLQLKRLTAQHLHPTSVTGQQIWKELLATSTESAQHDLQQRVWIVPKSLDLIQNDQAIFITDSSLEVLSAADYRQRAYAITQHHNQNHFNAMLRGKLLPQLTKSVNQDFSFQKIRTIYRLSVLADWHKAQLPYAWPGSKWIPNGPDPLTKNLFQKYKNLLNRQQHTGIIETYDASTQQTSQKQLITGGVRFPLPHISKDTHIKTANFKNIQPLPIQFTSAEQIKKSAKAALKKLLLNDNLRNSILNGHILYSEIERLIPQPHDRKYLIQQEYLIIQSKPDSTSHNKIFLKNQNKEQLKFGPATRTHIIRQFDQNLLIIGLLIHGGPLDLNIDIQAISSVLESFSTNNWDGLYDMANKFNTLIADVEPLRQSVIQSVSDFNALLSLYPQIEKQSQKSRAMIEQAYKQFRASNDALRNTLKELPLFDNMYIIDASKINAYLREEFIKKDPPFDIDQKTPLVHNIANGFNRLSILMTQWNALETPLPELFEVIKSQITSNRHSLLTLQNIAIEKDADEAVIKNIRIMLNFINQTSQTPQYSLSSALMKNDLYLIENIPAIQAFLAQDVNQYSQWISVTDIKNWTYNTQQQSIPIQPHVKLDSSLQNLDLNQMGIYVSIPLLKVVLSRMISNALKTKTSPETIRLILGFNKQSTHLNIQIINPGRIPDELMNADGLLHQQSKIFSAKRQDNVDGNPHGGVGLAFVYLAITNSFSGHLKVDNTMIRGQEHVIFTITLPLYKKTTHSGYFSQDTATRSMTEKAVGGINLNIDQNLPKEKTVSTHSFSNFLEHLPLIQMAPKNLRYINSILDQSQP